MSVLIVYKMCVLTGRLVNKQRLGIHKRSLRTFKKGGVHPGRDTGGRRIPWPKARKRLARAQRLAAELLRMGPVGWGWDMGEEEEDDMEDADDEGPTELRPNYPQRRVVLTRA